MDHILNVIFDKYNYTIVGDLAVIATCITIAILLRTSFVNRSRSFRIFMNVIALLSIAAGVNIAYHFLLVKNDPSLYTLIYVLRIVYQGILFDVMFLFTLYVTQVTGMDHKKARTVAIVSSVLLFMVIGIDIGMKIAGVGFKILDDGSVVTRSNIFVLGYAAYVIMLASLIYKAKSFLYKRILYGFYAIMVLSLAIRIAQLVLRRSSLSTMSFIFPVIAMMYVMHSNPYNITLGAVDLRSMENLVGNLYSKREPFVFMSLLLIEYDEDVIEIPVEIKSQIRKFASDYFKKGVLFQIGNGHLVLIFPKRNNPGYEHGIEKMMENFCIQFTRFRKSYKILMGDSVDEISEKNEYARFIRSINAKMDENSVKKIDEKDVENFNREDYILAELADIYRKRDMDDPRILTYCQPVFNLKTGCYDTAEALMRLDLEKTGIVFPDDFIPAAENQGYIHVLTQIILNKTCREIKKLIDEGYEITRISVNVSVLEIKDDNFCTDINSMIEKNAIPGEKVAIELTESRNEANFMIMKEKIEELHTRGIQFYLDDFGTGYSNMERIFELPFDIIKFDRSMVMASGTNKRSERIVDNLARMFKEMDYSVLYEGIENDDDAKRCGEMFASYLQGYKYSRPVPIEKLRDFLKKG